MNNNLKPIDQLLDNWKARNKSQSSTSSTRKSGKPSGTIPNSTAIASLRLKPILKAPMAGWS